MNITIGIFLIMTFGVALAILAFRPASPKVSTLEKVDYYSFKDEISFLHYGPEYIQKVVDAKEVQCELDFSRPTLENLVSTKDSWKDVPEGGNRALVDNLLKTNQFVMFAVTEGREAKTKIYLATLKNYVDAVYLSL